MRIELIQAAQQALSALEKSQPHPSNPVIGLTNQDFIDHEETIRQLRAALQQTEAQQPATTEPVEDGIRNAEDELNCAEEVLDAITCEFSDGEFPVTDFNCIGDYITAVVDVFKERLAAQQPATPEPVGFTYQAEIAYADSTGGNGSFWRVPPDLDDEAVPLYTHPAPSVPDGLQWFTVAEHGLPEVGAVVVGGLWYTDPYLKPECATSFMWGQCRVVDTKHRDFKDGKQWLTFGPSHNQITHWVRLNLPARLAAKNASA